MIEECPSPFVSKHPELREKLGSAAVRLAESINYGSAGTIEYLVDDETADFFFLEMNTRLQVEHGITEMCYGVDLVELMLKQADAELQGKGGLDAEYLQSLQPSEPTGAAIEARVYAENPAKDYAPSPGTLQSVKWNEIKGSRIDTWVHTGSKVTSHYDPLLAKAMFHGATRQEAIKGMTEILIGSRICGPPTNLEFLAAILQDPEFQAGNTMTKFLTSFKFAPAAIDILAGGAYTLIEDYPGRPTIGRGFSHSGPMDPLAFRIANFLVGNPAGKEGLEITLSGPDLKFLGAAIVALCGAPMEAKLDGESFPMWTRVKVTAGQRLTIGKTTGGGCRTYLAVYGGFPSVGEWFGSKSTAPMTAVGGYQGRALASGDLLGLVSDLPSTKDSDTDELKLPDHLIPQYPEHWELFSMAGPYDEGYLTQESIDTLYSTTWTISHNAARGGIRLIGPKPKWARDDGGEGGAHPSNVIEYGYPIGALNWTGDDPCLFPIDCPDFGGFVSSTTIVKAEFWRLGQMKAGNKLKFIRVSLQDAIAKRREVEEFVGSVEACCSGKSSWEDAFPLKYQGLPPSVQAKDWESAIIHQIPEKGTQPLVSYRQGGDDFILIDYGHGAFDLNYRFRAVALYQKLKEQTGDISFPDGMHTGMACGNCKSRLSLKHIILPSSTPQLIILNSPNALLQRPHHPPPENALPPLETRSRDRRPQRSAHAVPQIPPTPDLQVRETGRRHQALHRDSTALRLLPARHDGLRRQEQRLHGATVPRRLPQLRPHGRCRRLLLRPPHRPANRSAEADELSQDESFPGIHTGGPSELGRELHGSVQCREPGWLHAHGPDDPRGGHPGE